jgi:hypothetical protein
LSRCFGLLFHNLAPAFANAVGGLRVGIARFLSRRDEVHVNRKSATLGERWWNGRLSSRRLKHKIQGEPLSCSRMLARSRRLVLLCDHVIGPNSYVLIICVCDTAGLSAHLLYKQTILFTIRDMAPSFSQQ